MGIRTVRFHLNHFTQHNVILLNWFKKIINKYCLCHRIKMPPMIPVRKIVFLPKIRAAIDHNVAVNFHLIIAQSRNYTVPSLIPFPMSSVSWHGVCKNTSVAHQEQQLSLNWKCGGKKQLDHHWPASLSPSAQCVVAGSMHPTSFLFNCLAYKSSFFFSFLRLCNIPLYFCTKTIHFFSPPKWFYKFHFEGPQRVNSVWSSPIKIALSAGS